MVGKQNKKKYTQKKNKPTKKPTKALNDPDFLYCDPYLHLTLVSLDPESGPIKMNEAKLMI